eukprot:Phypoly_transcript_10137.p1 GENE.Phypoly_transcript_10137~~Phypoly_transcript_10137.p1  ORF type:complete len:420 (+),score=55.95 Phypoly_transcript_10137:51-1310(+)
MAARLVPKLSARTAGLLQFGNTSVFAEFTQLANKYSAVNLGQGFPNFPAPPFIKQAATKAIESDLNQYTRSQGHVRLANAIANTYGPKFNRKFNAMDEIVVTAGATEALFAAIQTLIDPGDEAILFEPFYDSYPAAIVMAGGTPKYVPLRINGSPFDTKNWSLNLQELEKSITPKTKLLILNNPQNTPGRIFSVEELQAISSIAIKHNLIVISDEVYEYLIYDGQQHTHIASLPGMWERTVTVSSAGKTFSTTGWKIGWVIAPQHLSSAIQMGRQWITFSIATPMQEAVAVALEKSPELNYFAELKDMYEKKRNRLYNILDKHGLTPIMPKGSYFMLADISKISEKAYLDQSDDSNKDYQFCRWLTKEIGVTAIPMKPFYSTTNAHIANNLVRFTFCKTDETLEEADKRLEAIHKFKVK